MISWMKKTIEVVQKLKDLGITLESQLLFKRQLNNTVNRSGVKSSNFRFIRSNLTRVSKILCSGSTSHCVTSWASACKTTLKSIETVFKQALKVLDRKSKTHHHCQVFKKAWALKLGQRSDVHRRHLDLLNLPWQRTSLQDFVKKKIKNIKKLKRINKSWFLEVTV